MILIEPTDERLINYIVDDIINKEKNYMKRLIGNEVIKIKNKAKLKCYYDLGISQYIVKENKDGKICEECSGQNEKIYPLSEFAIGKTAPPFHINCRGTIEPDLNLESEIEERIISGFTNKTPEVYNEHKENNPLFSYWYGKGI